MGSGVIREESGPRPPIEELSAAAARPPVNSRLFISRSSHSTTWESASDERGMARSTKMHSSIDCSCHRGPKPRNGSERSPNRSGEFFSPLRSSQICAIHAAQGSTICRFHAVEHESSTTRKLPFWPRLSATHCQKTILPLNCNCRLRFAWLLPICPEGRRAVDIAARRAKDRMVQEVKGLGTELKFLLSPDGERSNDG